MELRDLADIEKGTKSGRRETLRLGIGLLFVAGVVSR